MNTLIEWFGLDSGQFNEVTLNFVTKDMSLVWILALVLVPLALWFCWTSLNQIGSQLLKTFLISLRLLVFLLLVFLVLKPELEFKKSRILKNNIAGLVDDTKSMSIKSFPSENPRIDFVRQTLKKNRGELESLKNNFQVDYYFVSERIEPVVSTEIQER